MSDKLKEVIKEIKNVKDYDLYKDKDGNKTIRIKLKDKEFVIMEFKKEE